MLHLHHAVENRQTDDALLAAVGSRRRIEYKNIPYSDRVMWESEVLDMQEAVKCGGEV
jgi:uncharacterized cupin superfamily protein